MYFRRKWLVAASFCAMFASSEWYNNFAKTDPLHDVFWKTAPMPGGPVPARRTPREMRPLLAARLDLRALEAERAMDYVAAEQDWKQRPPIELADFYHRRNRAADEVQALLATGRQPSPDSEKLTPPAQQASWRAFERVFALIDAQALPSTEQGPAYQAWMLRYPKESSVPARYFGFLVKQKQFAAAGALIARYQRDFPGDHVFPVTARASLAEARGNGATAVAAYDQAFDPLWPDELQNAYFKLLSERRMLRDFLSRARADAAEKPDDLAPATRIFFYYSRQGNQAAARRALLEYRIRKEARHSDWTPAQLRTMARLFEASRDYVEAARAWQQLSETSGDGAAAEDGTAGLVGVLLNAPEQPIEFGSSDLTFLRDVATIDPYPGFLNGILSLVLNSTEPGAKFASLEGGPAVSYFHRAKAAELLAQLDTRFPRNARRPELHAALVEAYAAYGSDAGVIADGVKFLAEFRDAPQRLDVALRMAESYARTRRERDEFALYDSLLKDLGTRAGNVPLGTAAAAPAPLAEDQDNPAPPTGMPPVNRGRAPDSGARSPDYARILDRYVARLVSLRRVTDAATLYRREIDRNPSDPGLYERLAAFLDQNRRFAEVETVYGQAMSHFPDRSWHHKLARWYLRQKRTADFEKLTREVTGVFNGSDLSSYFSDVVTGPQVDAVMYRQLNLAAHDRFPENLIFVRNLLDAYTRNGTQNPAGIDALLRQYWPLDDGLRQRWLEHLSATNRLESELQATKTLAAAPGGFNAPATLFTAEAEIWQGHFEAAADPYDKLVADNPGDAAAVARDATLQRSLERVDRAVALEESLAKLDPRDRAPLTHAGEIQADREKYAAAAPYWNRIAAIEPGRADGYLEAATVFWDYYRYDDALRLIAAGRTKLHDPALYAYQAGAIYENKREYPAAVREYMKGALASDAESEARNRLVRLARRADLQPMIETAAATAAISPTQFALRTALLERDSTRRADLEAYLIGLAANTSSFDMLARVEQEAVKQGMDDVRQKAVEREIAVNKDPVEGMRLRLELAGLHEGRNQIPEARAIIVELYRDHPTILGVVRAAVDFNWRHNTPDGAITILQKAGDASYPAQKRAFLLEAARKCTEAKQYARSREILAQLTKDSPFNGEYLAAIADSYGQAGDDAGLREFYTTTLTALRDSKLSSDERIALTSQMRRGLIPALVRLKDFSGAVDQYIEVINRYPEDAAVTSEAANFAARNNLKPRLLDYYVKTAAQSPRDFRWPLVLARLRTQFEDFPSAISAYAAAIAIRPDRPDLLQARAELNERLLQFANALADYQKLYDLSYHDPAWMAKAAEADARLGKTQDAVAALRKAYIEGRPDKGENYNKVADQLAKWNLPEQALPFAEEGFKKSPGDYWTFLKLLMQLRRYDDAIKQLLSVPEEARNGALQRTLGGIAGTYYTAEEKAGFAAAVDKLTPEQRGQLVYLAEASATPDLYVRLLVERLNAKGEVQDRSQLEDIQKRRMKYSELGAMLEAFAATRQEIPEKNAELDRAVQAFREGGDETQELRLLELRLRSGLPPGPEMNRYLALVAARDPRRLVELARTGSGTDLRNAAATKAITMGDAALARAAMQARGAGISPVWSRAYTGLAGLYWSDASPEVAQAFTAALDSGTIGQRLGKTIDRREQLAGDIWFYYGARFGDYLDFLKRANAEDFLPASLEARPSSTSAFTGLADHYAETGNLAAALADYDRALELDRTLIAPNTGAAAALWKQGRRDEAVARWKLALAGCEKLTVDMRRFGEELGRVLESLKQAGAYSQVAPDAEKSLRVFFHSNGAMFDVRVLALAAELAGLPKTLDLAGAAPDELTLLETIVHAPWVADRDRGAILERIVALAERSVAENFGEARFQAEGLLRNWRIQYAEFLLDSKQPARAAELVAALRSSDKTHFDSIDVLEIRVAGLDPGGAKLDALFERYRRDPTVAASDATLADAAAQLRSTNAAARGRVLEFLYTRQLEANSPAPAAFLGLAEVRLEQNNVAAALVLLRRMNLVAGAPFENLMPSARALESHGHAVEANEFLAARIRAVPWDLEARAMQARLQRDTAALAAIARDPHAPAAMRARASGADPLAVAQRAGDATAKLRALLDAIAADPGNLETRVAVFHAAIDAHRDRLAVSALESLDLMRSINDGEEPSEEQYRRVVPRMVFFPQLPLNDGPRAALAGDLGHARERLGELVEAERLFGVASQYDPAGVWKREEDRVKAQIGRDSENAKRRPEIKVSLEQSRVVRPRLGGQP